jgi:phosphoribosylamine--glycine ligase
VKVFVVGSGGREHALCWRLARSPSVDRVFCAPGNPGTGQVGENVPIAVDALDELADFAGREAVDLTVVGPEVPLCAGIQDRFQERGLPLFGPTAAAARLEGSKAFAKHFMHEHGIPTAEFAVFEDPGRAAAYIDAHDDARVVKADGLAAGKGVFVTDSAADARRAVEELLAGGLGDAGRSVVVEQRLNGEEVSVLALSDGERVLALASSQDHKPVFDGDRGPNTGGMGAYSPAPVLTDALQRQVTEQVLLPTIRGLARAGHPYRGVLYAGLMIVDGQLSVLEFNCRFGDPETQPLMARFDDDLFVYLLGAARGELPARAPRWDPRAALCVVMAAEGYPGSYAKGRPIDGLEGVGAGDALVVFHAGTAVDSTGRLVTSGGRVLGVTALGDGLAQARDRAYGAVAGIRWDGAHYRSDIGHRGLCS